jgi:hypothetical protein
MYETYITQQSKLTHKYEFKLDKHMMKTNRNYTNYFVTFSSSIFSKISLVLHCKLLPKLVLPDLHNGIFYVHGRQTYLKILN